ncbi:MAG: response regulator [Chloroflexota bacterium]
MTDLYALIIEDNSYDASVLQKLLARLNIRHDVLFDSRTFIEDLHQCDRPNVIFLDLEIPGMSGYEVMTLIQQMPEYTGVPVVAYTSNAAQMSEARAAGFHSFLGKPLRGSDFPAQLERILQDQPVWEVR